MELESIVFTDAIKKLKWIKTLFAKLSPLNSKSNDRLHKLLSYNQDAIALAIISVSCSYIKHINLYLYFIWQAI